MLRPNYGSNIQKSNLFHPHTLAEMSEMQNSHIISTALTYESSSHASQAMTMQVKKK
jgi:hypothetical protein